MEARVAFVILLMLVLYVWCTCLSSCNLLIVNCHHRQEYHLLYCSSWFCCCCCRYQNYTYDMTVPQLLKFLQSSVLTGNFNWKETELALFWLIDLESWVQDLSFYTELDIIDKIIKSQTLMFQKEPNPALEITEKSRIPALEIAKLWRI